MGQQIKPSDAETLLENWKNGPGKAITNSNYKDAYETWFSVDELMEYLQYVKDNIPNNPGVRVYFGKYDEDAGPGKEKGLTTVFFAPTKGGSHDNPEEIENEKELDPFNLGTNGWPPSNY
tara:strand:+ start:1470 stop:1829 length:360 start_codon:yes stop_codon:yes gene_type:complete